MNSMPLCRLLTRYEVVSRAAAAGLRERSYSLSSVVCSWHICSVGRLEQASILSCDVCSGLTANFSYASQTATEEDIPQATEVR